MKALIDSIFGPVLDWLTSMIDLLHEASIPAARPLDPSDYLGIYAQVGAGWIGFIASAMLMFVVYVVVYVVMVHNGVYLKFKKSIKWW